MKSRQEYIQEDIALKFRDRLQEALKKGGRITSTNTCLQHVEYHYRGDNQVARITYYNIYWAVVEYDSEP